MAIEISLAGNVANRTQGSITQGKSLLEAGHAFRIPARSIPARTDCEFFEASELPCFRFGDFFDWPSQFVAFLAFGDSVISSLEAEQLSSS